MSLCKWCIVGLLLLLIGSNAWWTYRSIEQGVSQTYFTVSLTDEKEALDQTLSLIPLIASGDDTKNDLLDHLKSNFDVFGEFEKEGYLWIGKLGIKFDDSERLLEIRRAWE